MSQYLLYIYVYTHEEGAVFNIFP